MKLLSLIKKEILVLRRDIHGLLLLFIMPLIFIVIMSLALRDVFSQHADFRIRVGVVDNVGDERSRALLDELKKSTSFIFERSSSDTEKEASLILKINEPPVLLRSMEASSPEHLLLSVSVAPDTQSYIVVLFTALLREAQARIHIQDIRDELIRSGANAAVLTRLSQYLSPPEAQVDYRYRDERDEIPNAVQQNVPAWLVFAMFFIVVPLSNSLLNEEKSGTLRRLHTYNIAPGILLLGKLVPYFVINQIQVVLMLCAGVWLLPILGGDKLQINTDLLTLGTLALLSASVSIAALGYALLIATLARTTEQATTLGGVGNILLAAIGGVMVPVFVMPDFMQRAAEYSPMYWAVDGFLDIILRGGGVAEILPSCGLLVALGFLLLLAAAVLLGRRVMRPG